MNPIKYSDLIKADDTIKDLAQQLDEASDAYTNLANNVKQRAAELQKQLQAVSGATSEGRKAISAASSDAAKLAKAEEALAFASSRTGRQLRELNMERQQANRLAKLRIQYDRSAEGSYNKLSAQYSLLKMRLNEMSAAERLSTTEGKALETEAAAIYEQMNNLQKATGKFTLQVGNYELGFASSREAMSYLRMELVKLRSEGKENTLEYQNMLKKAGELQDQITDTTASIKNMASDTSTLDSILGGISAASGGFSAITGAMTLFGAGSEEVAEAQKKLQAAIAITTGLTAIQNAGQKQSALMLGISKVQSAALAKAEAYRRLITMQGTKATKAATVAQTAFNLVAKANPYILLATALVSVVGALVLFAVSGSKAAKEQQKLNAANAADLDLLEAQSKELQRVSSERQAAYSRELNEAKSRNASISELRKIEDAMFAERKRNNAQQQTLYAKELNSLDQNRAKIEQLQKTLEALQKVQARGRKKVTLDVDLDGKIERVKVDDAIDAVQGQIDNLGRSVTVAVDLQTEEKDLQSEIRQAINARIIENRNLEKQNTDIVRAAEDARIKLIENSYQQQRATLLAAGRRQIEDLRSQLATEANLSAKARAALKDRILATEQQLANDLADLRNKERADQLAAMRTTEDARLELVTNSAEKMRAQLLNDYRRRSEDLQMQLDTDRGLTMQARQQLFEQLAILQQRYAQESAALEADIAIQQANTEKTRINNRLEVVRAGTEEEIRLRLELLEQERRIELAENRKLSEDLQQDELAINAKYNKLIMAEDAKLRSDRAMQMFDMQQALSASEFDLIRSTEAEKTRFRLEQEKARLQKVLELNETAAEKLSDMEVATIRNTIARINRDIRDTRRGNVEDIYDLFGLRLNDNEKQGLNDSANYAIEQIGNILAARVEAAEKAREAAETEVESAKKLLDAELEARANGYANNVEMAQKQLALAKKTQEQALRQEQQAQRQQEALDTIQQASSLAVGVAKTLSQFGWYGIPLVALMLGTFAAAKIQALKLARQGATETYGEGTVELLRGGSHASGNDIDLGTKPDGTRRRAEGGEYFAVINKRNSRRFRRIIPDVVKSLNDGTFLRKYGRAYAGADGLAVNISGGSADLSGLGADVRAIKEQGLRRTYVDPRGHTTIMYKNLTRRIS